MRLRNEYGEKVSWRVFKGDDTAYVTGLKQGEVNNGETASWRDDSFPDIKVEAVKGDIVFGTVVARAGTKFKMSDDLLLEKGGVLKIAPVRAVDDRGKEKKTASDIQFIDVRSFNGSVERTIVSKISNTFTSSALSESSSSHEQIWKVGAEIGGMIGQKDVKNVHGDLSLEFQDKVVNSLRSSNQSTVSSVWEKSVSDKINFAGGKMYVVETIWTLTLDKGTISYMGDQTTYSVVRSAEATLLRPVAYDSIDAMPQKYKDKLNEVQRAHA